ncbi:hypothetical protein [Paraburkholderia sp. BCC1885]|jgi:hypothetical protein|uniref:hypothetical protein n=1 Tax=Paraburkholderia sp. BCC1885 TaxID=2562669 RepID=UPI0011841C9D|nr:hypothetical protein [Paraburkholderia sp. BCC1885]
MTNLLSHHEIATLFVLYHSPERVAPADPDVLPLQHAHLVEVVAAESGQTSCRITSKGHELVRRFGVAKRKERRVEPVASAAVEASERMHA